MKDFGGNWKQQTELENQSIFLKGCSIIADDAAEKNIFDRQEQEINDKIEQVQHEQIRSKLTDPKKKREGLGMICLSLDQVLKKHNITPQKFHSRSFVGNHCHKYLQPEVFKDISDFVVKKTEEVSSCPFVLDSAHEIKSNFDNINAHLSNVHHAISHCRPMSNEDIQNWA